ncbi:MAG TPA: HisA/HisF-related TIM barrel protein, partial [Clostridia bacterium]|nr:HisA/HisF-related TIM barrel protein [Clostridia bacterium]
MRFRPCIDIHEGKVKQIVGSSISDNSVLENFVSTKDAEYYANLFKKDNLKGGHVIKLCKSKKTEEEAIKALKAFPSGMQIGGGINADNCLKYLSLGASHVIVTSFIFHDG